MRGDEHGGVRILAIKQRAMADVLFGWQAPLPDKIGMIAAFFVANTGGNFVIENGSGERRHRLWRNCAARISVSPTRGEASARLIFRAGPINPLITPAQRRDIGHRIGAHYSVNGSVAAVAQMDVQFIERIGPIDPIDASNQSQAIERLEFPPEPQI